MKCSKRYLLSCGPGLDSGWYCIENALYSGQLSPAKVLSFRFMCVGIIFFDNDCISTPNPWFWLVISILPLLIFFTGWLIPLCPNFSLKVEAPKARAKIWCPKHIPKIGAHPNKDCTVLIA